MAETEPSPKVLEGLKQIFEFAVYYGRTDLIDCCILSDENIKNCNPDLKRLLTINIIRDHLHGIRIQDTNKVLQMFQALVPECWRKDANSNYVKIQVELIYFMLLHHMGQENLDVNAIDKLIEDLGLLAGDTPTPASQAGDLLIHSVIPEETLEQIREDFTSVIKLLTANPNPLVESDVSKTLKRKFTKLTRDHRIDNLRECFTTYTKPFFVAYGEPQLVTKKKKKRTASSKVLKEPVRLRATEISRLLKDMGHQDGDHAMGLIRNGSNEVVTNFLKDNNRRKNQPDEINDEMEEENREVAPIFEDSVSEHSTTDVPGQQHNDEAVPTNTSRRKKRKRKRNEIEVEETNSVEKPPKKIMRRKSYTSRGKRSWTEKEDAALLTGISRYGVGRWIDILADDELKDALSRRSNVNLKDRWRTLGRLAQIIYQKIEGGEAIIG